METFERYYERLSADGKRDYAAAAGTTPAYLSHLATGKRKASPKLAQRLHRASHGIVSLASIRPDIWIQEKRA